MNLKKQNFLEQQLILKEIELSAYQVLNSEQPDNKTWDDKSEAVVEMQVSLLKEEIAELKKQNFPDIVV